MEKWIIQDWGRKNVKDDPEKITSSNYWKARKLSKTTWVVSEHYRSQLEEAPHGQGRTICASINIVTAVDRNTLDVIEFMSSS